MWGDSLETSQTSSQDALLAYFPLCSRHHAFLERRHYHDRADQQQQRITPGTHKYKLVLAILAILCSQGRLRVGGDALRGKIGGVGGMATATGCVALLLPRWLSAQIAPENWCARPNQKSWVDAGRSVGGKKSLQVLHSHLRISGPIGSEAHPQVPVKRAHEGVK